MNHTSRRPTCVRKVLRSVAALAVSTGIVGLIACSDEEGSTPDSSTTGAEAAAPAETAEVLTALSDEVIVPGYVALDEDLRALTSATDRLCREPSGEALEQARSAWRDAVDSWTYTTPLGIGPAMEQRLMSAVAFAPRWSSITKLLDGDHAVDVASVRDLGANVRGIFAVEHGLWDEGADSLTTATPEGARRCEYLHSIATLASEAASDVLADWQGSGGSAFVDADGSGPEESVALLLNSLTHRVKAIDEQGLRDLAAAQSYDDLDDGRRDGPGGYAVAEHQGALSGASAAIGSGSNGLVGLVRARSPETADRLEAAAAAAVDAVEALPDSAEALYAGGDEMAARVDAASEAVAALKVLLVTEVASQMGVTITLSDGDGDA